MCYHMQAESAGFCMLLQGKDSVPMIDQFTAAGLLHRDPEFRTMKNGSRFLSAVLVCSRQLSADRQRKTGNGSQAELVEITFFDQPSMDLLQQCRKGDFISATGYMRSVYHQRPDGSGYYFTSLIGTGLLRLEEKRHG